MSAPSSGIPSNATSVEYTLTGGPRWYQRRIRTYGPALALLIPAVIGAIAYLSLQWSDSSWSGPVGLLGGYAAAPALLAIGAPFADRNTYPLAVAASAVMWLLIGVLASRRATRNPMATWSDYWRHLMWMMMGVWVGVLIALAIATVRIGSGVIDWN